ncbi:aminotransferase class V-fold PLP-dependent enzyme [Rudanella lutea]|uniref:aminotransferase class V-fold PLP-dependent enzyme n=1 Tax=Rudanella lutea TaxID=451374 RepID=UPI00037A8D36|nr:aminotransferase class V-fold PLP-dependent enzyme [Rudanella lutea]
MTKRDFLRSFTGLAALPFTPLHNLLQTIEGLPADTVAREEAFWESLRSHFTVTNDFIHLENGYYILAANEVMDALVNHARTVNRVSSYYMRTRQFDDKLAVRKQLAEVVGCSSDELIITRNTTESLDTVISGIDWKRGDEAVMAVQDYGAMLDMFAQQARRYGIVNREVELPNHPQSDDELVSLYEKAITPRTRLLMLCHIVNITGQILPVRKIADMAHRHGVEVMVDGAHAVGHFDFRLPDLGCDYYGSSLHKWLGCPLGAGMLYVRRDKVKGLWPMFGDAGFADDDIRKLNHTGTHPVHTDLALADAIRFHQMIGIARKEARLRYLQTYWTSKVRSVPNIIVNTPAYPARMCGIANVGIRGMKPTDLAKTLFDRYRIWTVGIERANVQGVRVTPHLYTTTAELDTLVKALRELAA